MQQKGNENVHGEWQQNGNQYIQQEEVDLTWESKQGEKKREIQLFTKKRKFFPKNLAWEEAWNG